jgi:hypothetical protein
MENECCDNAHNTEHARECCAGSKESATCCRSSEPLIPMTLEQIESLPTDTLVRRFRRGLEVLDPRMFQLTEEMLDRAFLPEAGVGLWPVRVLIGHIVDADLAAIHRIRRAVAEDHPVFAEWDENAFVDSGIYGNASKAYAPTAEGDKARVMNVLGGFLATLHTVRQWTSDWLSTLTEKQWNRTGLHPSRGPLSVRKMVAMYTYHLEHHAGYLTKKLDLMLGSASSPREGASRSCECGCK